MSAMKNIGAITGLHPFSLNRTSFIVAFSIAALVIAKLVDAYLFCGFNENFFVDVPLGVVLFPGYCIMPLLGLAVKRKPTTKGGRCCRTFAIVLICSWQVLTFFAIMMVQYFVYIMSSNDKAAYDPFNICGKRTIDNIRPQFRNAMSAFDIFQRIDLIYKIVVALGWLVLWPFPYLVFAFFLDSLAAPPPSKRHQACKDPESGKSAEENDETIIWIDERSEGKAEQSSAVAEHGSMDIEDESAPADAAQQAGDRKSEVGNVDVRMENLRNEINEPGSNAEPQSKEAKEPKFGVVDEEEAPTTARSTTEDSK